MEAFRSDKSLEAVVEELLNDEDIQKMTDPVLIAKAKIYKLRAEMRRYLNRPHMYKPQIDYITEKMNEVLEEHPDLKNELNM